MTHSIKTPVVFFPGTLCDERIFIPLWQALNANGNSLVNKAFVPLQWQWLLAAFVLFRLFDIYKPWPIRQLDKNISGGFGIMVDDILAAVYTIALLAIAQYLLIRL